MFNRIMRAAMVRMVLAIALALPACLPFFASRPAAAQAAPKTAVDLELILMADCSGSVDDSEFALQRLGYAKALRDPAILQAIRSGILRRIALAYVEWSGPELHVPIVDWVVIENAADLAAFAKTLEDHPRELYGGGTAVGNAILYGMQSILGNAYEGTRRVIDVSGDGPDRNGLPAVVGRDQAVASRMTVNGLPIQEFKEDGLDVFYRDNVIGGPGAFYVSAAGFQDFAAAIRRKLILEIAGTPPVRGTQAAEVPR